MIHRMKRGVFNPAAVVSDRRAQSSAGKTVCELVLLLAGGSEG